MGRTSRGTHLTEDLLDRLVEEAEQGFDEEQLTVRRGPGRPRLSEGEGPSNSVNVRLDDDLRRRLADRADQNGTTASAVVRDALRRHLDEEPA